MLEVIHGGLMTTVQDLGRPGFRSKGIPISGAMDRFALKCGNLLVGNELSEAGLEILLMGLKLRALSCMLIAITGANLTPQINERRCPMWEPIRIETGDTIYFPNFPKYGCRAYLCVRGGIKVPRILGSKSTYVDAGFGGFQGRSLKNGDILEIESAPPGSPFLEGIRLDFPLVSRYSDLTVLRVILGSENELFTEEAIETFLNHEWRVSSKANRNAVRMDESFQLPFKPRSEREMLEGGGTVSGIIPTATPLGAIQVVLGREVTIICSDGQTRGAHARIGTVIDADLDKVGQLKTGDKVKFQLVSLETAYQIAEDDHRIFAQLSPE